MTGKFTTYLHQPLSVLAPPGETGLPAFAVRPAGLVEVLGRLSPGDAAYARASGFKAAARDVLLLPGPDGIAGALLGLGEDRTHTAFGTFATRLPSGTVWRLDAGDFDRDAAVLGWCLGAYRYTAFKEGGDAPARLIAGDEARAARIAAEATFMVRDLINAPANILGPDELAAVALELAAAYGGTAERVSGDALDQGYPALAAVGRGSARAPSVTILHWASPNARSDAPLVALCGKGVCFDTGGYDLKPSAGMLRMKKDMGGAAVVLGLARMIMEHRLPVRLDVRIGCVENSVSGNAMRPLDVLKTRKGLTVEIGNTDAEGRLVLCDLLTAAGERKPDLLIDCSTLTGAARVGLGPDLPALFSNDDGWAAAIERAGHAVNDPVWRLPLWNGYDQWLDSRVADLNNVSAKPFAGAIVAALFLQRFVHSETKWAHFDLYGWNDSTAPARPEGGEAQTMRAALAALADFVKKNTDETR